MLQWIKYFLVGIAHTSKQAVQTLSNIIALKAEHEGIIHAQFGKRMKSGLLLHHYLLQQPLVSIKDVNKICHLSAKASGELINTFLDKQILKEFTGLARNRLFIYEAYLNLFED